MRGPLLFPMNHSSCHHHHLHSSHWRRSAQFDLTSTDSWLEQTAPANQWRRETYFAIVVLITNPPRSRFREPQKSPTRDNRICHRLNHDHPIKTTFYSIWTAWQANENKPNIKANWMAFELFSLTFSYFGLFAVRFSRGRPLLFFQQCSGCSSWLKNEKKWHIEQVID